MKEARKLGRYELLFRVASGGMAEVYAGRVLGEAGFQKLVAIKSMLPSLADDEEFVQMFLDEARLAANISSPYVVQTFDLGRHTDGSLYIVMELVVGAALSRLVRSARKTGTPVPIGVAVEILTQAAQGLHDAHEATTPIGEPLEIVHRDISPQNILVGLDGRVRITDFGVARAVLRLTQTVAGKIKGKFAYSSPEQLGDGPIDRRSDVFSLGIVGWETLTGNRLFVGEHPMQTMDRVKNMAIPRVSDLRPDVPAGISDVIERALARDSEDRFPTSKAFGEALRAAAEQCALMPSTEEFRQFVARRGGEPLRRIRTNIKRALSNDANFESYRESVEVQLGSAPGNSRGEESTSGVVERPDEESSLPISVEPPSFAGGMESQPPTISATTGNHSVPRTTVTEATAIPSAGSRLAFAGLLLLLAIGVSGGTWWLLKERAAIETPAVAAEPRPSSSSETIVEPGPDRNDPEARDDIDSSNSSRTETDSPATAQPQSEQTTSSTSGRDRTGDPIEPATGSRESTARPSRAASTTRREREVESSDDRDATGTMPTETPVATSNQPSETTATQESEPRRPQRGAAGTIMFDPEFFRMVEPRTPSPERRAPDFE